MAWVYRVNWTDNVVYVSTAKGVDRFEEKENVTRVDAAKECNRLATVVELGETWECKLRCLLGDMLDVLPAEAKKLPEVKSVVRYLNRQPDADEP